jgi:hypothetical protein
VSAPWARSHGLRNRTQSGLTFISG